MRRFLILAASLALAGPAFAGPAVSLKADITDADGVVTLGDLFDGAGAAARTPVARRQGPTLVLSAQLVQAAVQRAGLTWPNADGVRRIIVQGGADGVSGPVAAGAARGNVQVLTYARDLSAGEIVQPQDLVWGKAAAAPYDAPSDADLLIGQSARRPLRAGAVAAAHDVAPTQVIKAGEIITVTYDDGGISLSLQGKAMGAAGVGETVNVQNPSSTKIIQAVVTGPGQAIVGPAADQMKTLRSSRYALR